MKVNKVHTSQVKLGQVRASYDRSSKVRKVRSEIFLTSNLFLTQNFFVPNNFCTQNFVGSKKVKSSWGRSDQLMKCQVKLGLVKSDR